MTQQRDKQSMSRFDTLLWTLGESSGTLKPLRQLVGSVQAIPREPITVETLIADDVAPVEALSYRFPQAEVRSVGLVSLMRIEHPDGPFVLSTWPSGYDGVFHLVGSVPSTDKRWQRVERAIGSATGLSACFLNHEDFVAIGTALSEHGRVEVSRLTARRPIDASSLQRGWQQQGGSLRPDPPQAIGQAEEEDASVRTLTLHVSSDDERPVLNLHIRRLAGATFYSGDFAIFDDVVLSRLSAGAARRAQLLSGRARTVEDPLPRPISVQLLKPVMVDAEATGTVLDVLKEGNALSVAVMHRNPYLHVLVTDNSDGSNFDVVVTETNSIDIFPGFLAKMGTFNRLTQRLSEHFEAFAIIEAAPVETVSLADLVSST